MLISLGMRKSGLSAKTTEFPTDLTLAQPYDSLGELAKTHGTHFDAMATTGTGFFGTSGTATGMHQAGAYLWQQTADNVSPGSTNFWVNDNGTRSAQYTAELAAFSADSGSINTMIIYGGTNDANPSGNITKAHYKAGLETLLSFYRADFPNVVRFFLVPLHRSLDAGASDANYQAIKEAQMEFVSEQADVEWAGEIYDRDITASPDPVHPTASEFQGEIARRHLEQIAGAYNKSGAIGAIGPRVTAASWESDHALLTITHDGQGSDFSALDADAEKLFAFDVDGTVHKASAVSRIDAGTLKVDFDDSGFFTPDQNDSFKIGYGALKGLSRTNPVVVKDNAAHPLPLRQSIITPYITDPLLRMDYTLDLSAKAGLKTLSGSDVTQIIDRSGGAWTAASGREPRYESAHNGALIAADSSTSLRSPAFSATSEGLVFLVWEAPSVFTNAQPFLLGTAAAGSFDAALYSNASDSLFWGTDAASGYPQIASGYEGQKAVLCLNYTNGNMDVYYNETTPTISFDPKDAFATLNHLWLFAQSDSATAPAGFKYHRVWFRNKNHGEAGDANIADIMRYLANHYGAVLS